MPGPLEGNRTVNDKSVSYVASPPPSRWTYLQTAVIVLVSAELLNVSTQLGLVQQLELKYSSIACAVVTLVIVAWLFLNPLTRQLTIDYAEKTVNVDFVTLTDRHRRLAIPFERLNSTTEHAADDPMKWKSWLLRDQEKVYFLLSTETGFNLEQMNDFQRRVQEIANQRQL